MLRKKKKPVLCYIHEDGIALHEGSNACSTQEGMGRFKWDVWRIHEDRDTVCSIQYLKSLPSMSEASANQLWACVKDQPV